MNHFGLLVLAETTSVFSRLSARVGLLMSAAVGIAMPLMLYVMLNSGMVINGVDSTDYFAASATDGLSWGLTARNFLLVRAFLVVLGAQVIAGELSARTLRETLLRPVSRDAVVFAKWIALLAWDVVSLATTFVFGALFGVLTLELDGYWVDILLATALNLVCDAGLIAVVFAVGALTRSTVATIAGLLVAIMLDKMLGWGMMFASGVAEMLQSSPMVVKIVGSWPMLPSAAFNLWQTVLPDYEMDARSVASLVLLTAGGLLATMLRLRRMEVP